MATRRRSAFYFRIPGEDRPVKVLAYSADRALALVRTKYPDARPVAKSQILPPGFRAVDEAAVRRLARSWGITWPITFNITSATRTAGTCKTDFIRRRHSINLTRFTTDPEATIRHELGHALDHEQQYAASGNNGRAVIAATRTDRRENGYRGSEAERFARSHEVRDLHIRLTR